MFEFDQNIVQALLSENVSFKSLYQKHEDLNRQVEEAVNDNAVGDETVHDMKKAKLETMDQMAQMIEDYRSAHA